MQWISGFFARVVKQTRRSLGLVSTGAIVAVGLILLRDTGALQPLEWLVLDYGLTWAAPNYPDDRLLLVTIDDRDVEKLGHYPLYDQDLAHAITILKGSDPVAIGLNIYRNFSVPPGSTQLLQVIEQTPELVAVEPGTPAFNRSPLAALTPEQQGIDNILVDRDGRVRRALLAYRSIVPAPLGTSPDLKQSLATRLALRYLQSQKRSTYAWTDQSLQWGNNRIFPLQRNSGGYVNLNPTGFQILLLSWQSLDQFDRVSLTDLLMGAVPADRIRGRIVLLGTVSPLHGPFFQTPRRSSPDLLMASGLEIQANTIIQLLALAEGLSPLQGWSDPLEYLWILLWSMVGSSLAALGQFRMACNLKESEFPDSLQNPPDRGQDLGQDSLGQDLGKNLGQDSLGKNLGQDFGQRSSSYVWIATAITLILAGGSVLAIHQGLWLPALPAILSLWGSISAPGLVFCPRAATSPTFAETI